MREDKRVGVGADGQPEYFPCMDHDRVLNAEAHKVVAFNAPAAIDDDHNQAFDFGIQRQSRLHRLVLRLNGGFASPILFIRGLGANLNTRMIESDLAAADYSTVWRTGKLPTS